MLRGANRGARLQRSSTNTSGIKHDFDIFNRNKEADHQKCGSVIRNKIRTPPTSGRKFIERTVNNFGTNNVDEKDVTRTVYLMCTRTPTKKVFRPYSCYTSLNADSERVYRRNCNFIIRALDNPNTNRRILLDHIFKMERWMIKLKEEPDTRIFSSVCPDKIKSFARLK